MILRFVVALSLVARFAPAQSGCKPVEGDQILGRHLAGALPAFQRIPPDTVLANMPLPGSQRILHATELASLAQRYSIPLASAEDVCFEWPMQALDREKVVDAMRASLGVPGADIKIADMSLSKVPPGRIEFPRERLSAGGSPVLWRGDVIYGDHHRFAIWARVRVQVACERLLVTANLKQGQLIEPGMVKSQAGQCSPDDKTPLTAEGAVGLMAVHALAAGAEIRPDSLAPPNDVNRGDSVQVEVHSGAAKLAFVATAESSGRNGDVVSVRNPSSNRIFRARVEGKDRVVVNTEVSNVP